MKTAADHLLPSLPCSPRPPQQQVGYLIRGNMRKPRLEVFDALCAKVTELFGE